MKLASLLLSLGLAAAVPTSSGLHRRKEGGDGSGDEESKPQEVARRLLVGVKSMIFALDFTSDGTKEKSSFSTVTASSLPEVNPSWMLFQKPDTVYAVNEDSDKLQVFHYDPAKGDLVDARTPASAAGIVHLEANQEGTRMLASAYGAGIIQVWDISGGRDSAKSVKDLNPNDTATPSEAEPQGKPQPHQAVLHPMKNLFAVNDIGTDTILVVNGQKDDDYQITNHFSVESGCGPRHGVFHGEDPDLIYTVACEKSNTLLSYTVTTTKDSLDFKFRQLMSTFDPQHPPENITSAAAGALVSTNDGDHLYVSNRQTGEGTDSITAFKIVDGTLEFDGSVSSARSNPRALALSEDEQVLFVADMENSKGLHAFLKNKDGTLAGKPLASADLSAQLGESAESGPQFVIEVPTAKPKKPTG